MLRGRPVARTIQRSQAWSSEPCRLVAPQPSDTHPPVASSGRDSVLSWEVNGTATVQVPVMLRLKGKSRTHYSELSGSFRAARASAYRASRSYRKATSSMTALASGSVISAAASSASAASCLHLAAGATSFDIEVLSPTSNALIAKWFRGLKKWGLRSTQRTEGVPTRGVKRSSAEDMPSAGWRHVARTTGGQQLYSLGRPSPATSAGTRSAKPSCK